MGGLTLSEEWIERWGRGKRGSGRREGRGAGIGM